VEQVKAHHSMVGSQPFHKCLDELEKLATDKHSSLFREEKMFQNNIDLLRRNVDRQIIVSHRQPEVNVIKLLPS
jgi:hypothetical protein